MAEVAMRASGFDFSCVVFPSTARRNSRTISDAFDQTLSGASHVDMLELDLIVGSGGVLSHASLWIVERRQ